MLVIFHRYSLYVSLNLVYIKINVTGKQMCALHTQIYNNWYFNMFNESNKKEAHASLFIVMPYFLIGLKTSRPPINGRKTSGITTDPSSC